MSTPLLLSELWWLPWCCVSQWDVDVYVDGTVVEAYSNGVSAVITSRVYPTLSDSVHAQLRAENAIATVEVDYYEMDGAVIH